MSLLHRYLTTFGFVVLLCSSGLFAADTIEDYQPLLDNSPFLTQAFKNRLAKSDSSGIKSYYFVGYSGKGEQSKLCLVHKKTKLATWIQIDETLEGHTLTEFNSKKRILTFEKDGISSTISMEQPK